MGVPATVVVQDRAGVRHVTLDRPPVNALSMTEYWALADAFERVDEVKVFLLRSRGRAWSAGQDLSEMGGLTAGVDRAAYVERAARCVAAVAACPVPVVTVFDGPAVGAGALLVACSDIVLATPGATLAFPEVRLGLRMGRSLLSGVLPDPMISHAFATGAAITSAQLHAVGFVAEMLASSDLEGRAETLVEELTALSTDSLRWLRAGRRPAERARAYVEETALAVGSWS